MCVMEGSIASAHISRFNYGVFFHAVRDIDLQSEEYLNMYTFTLPTITVPPFNNSLRSAAQLNLIASQLFNTARQQSLYIQTALEDIESIIPELPLNKQRSARGLCDACGSILKSLFGLSTSQDT